MDFALNNAAWSLERTYGQGNAHSNHELYAWEGLLPRFNKFLEAGEKLKKSPDEMAALIKSAAHHLGADLVGICRVHPSWVYSHEFDLASGEHRPFDLPEGCNQAIVMALSMDYETVRSSALVLQGVTTGLTYSKMAMVSNALAVFIRLLGYRAVPSGNDSVLSIPLAMAAGLGECGRMGLLITQPFGPRVRLCKVFTDLPLSNDSYRPFGVAEFCRTCKVCARSCPSSAISFGPPTSSGYNISNCSGPTKWYINSEKCWSFWAKNRTNCTNCIRSCPFNKPTGLSHDLVRSLIRAKNGFLNRAIVKMDSLFGYQKKRKVDAFWK